MEASRPPPVSPPAWRRPLDTSSTLPHLQAHQKPEILKSEDYNTNRVHSSVGKAVPTLSSPASAYQGPPPPYSASYSNPQVVTASNGSQIPYGSPPDSRRDSHEDRMAAEGQPRQALPSISEALARLPGMSPRQRHAQANGSTAPSGPYQQAAGAQGIVDQSSQYTGQPRSRSDAFPPVPTRTYSPPQPRHNSFDTRPQVANRALHMGHVGSPSLGHHRFSTSSSTTNSPVEPPTGQRASPRIQTSYTSVPPAPYYQSALPSPQQGSNPPLSARSASDSFPTSHLQHSQSAYPQHTSPVSTLPQGNQHPGGAYSFPPHPTSGLTYEQSLAAQQQQQPQQPQPPRQWVPNPEFEKVDERRRAAAEHGRPGGNYAVTVKRHLDDFDLEVNLNDYGVKAHQYSRSVIPVAELPRLEDCDRMLDDAIALRAALERVRKMVEDQKHFAEQTAAQQGMNTKPGGYAPFGSENGPAGLSDKGLDKGESASGGFAGADPKKRRGRNAPPGRCHSCNRVETPEWRRGPDGARTLCNACGLHYAKLTKKLNSGKDGKASSEAPQGEP